MSGYGGNNNTTTRFRKYYGKYYNVDNNKIKPLIQEYIDAEHLLQPNRWYKVIITVAKGKTSFEVNGEKLFELTDKELYSDGYFGIRLLSNRALLRDLQSIIYKTRVKHTSLSFYKFKHESKMHDTPSCTM